MKHFTLKNIFSLFILVLLNVQASASAIKSCSQMMMQQVSSHSTLNAHLTNSAINSEAAHQQMDHSQHHVMSTDDMGMSEEHTTDRVNDCCADNCLCDMASCTYSTVAHQSAENFLTIASQQNKILFVAVAHQSQFLTYLFKPPIQQ